MPIDRDLARKIQTEREKYIKEEGFEMLKSIMSRTPLAPGVEVLNSIVYIADKANKLKDQEFTTFLNNSLFLLKIKKIFNELFFILKGIELANNIPIICKLNIINITIKINKFYSDYKDKEFNLISRVFAQINTDQNIKIFKEFIDELEKNINMSLNLFNTHLIKLSIDQDIESKNFLKKLFESEEYRNLNEESISIEEGETFQTIMRDLNFKFSNFIENRRKQKCEIDEINEKSNNFTKQYSQLVQVPGFVPGLSQAQTSPQATEQGQSSEPATEQRQSSAPVSASATEEGQQSKQVKVKKKYGFFGGRKTKRRIKKRLVNHKNLYFHKTNKRRSFGKNRY
jgi:hypothetical protein